MIRNFLYRLFSRRKNHRKLPASPKRLRRIAIEPLETRRLLAATGSISGFVYLDPANSGQYASGDQGIAGMTVELLSVGSSGSTTLVTPGGITTTAGDGSYSFPSLSNTSATNYEVEIFPASQLMVGAASPGSAGGTAGTNNIQLSLSAGQAATDYNFALLGANTAYISARMDLATTGTLSNFLSSSVLNAPTIETNGTSSISSAASTTYSTSYMLGGTAVDVAPNATVNSTESPDLLWATATIENPVGSGDTLSATIPSGSGLSQDFSGDTLTISGVASAATYESVLQSITYSTTATAPGTINPTVSIIVSDGTTESAEYTTSITILPGSQVAPTVTSNPTSATVDAGGTATFTAAASGTPTPTVQWEVSTDGGTTFTDISGATSTTYSFTATASQSGDEYKAVFTNNVDTATTTAATLTVDSVTTQPASQTVNTGQSVTFTTASSNPGSADTVQWEVSTDGGTTFTAISGATSLTYNFTATASQNGDEYKAVFTNSEGTFSSNPATLTVDSVTTQPASQTVNTGQSVTFTTASSNSADTVQWQVSTDGGTTFTAITGATSLTYSFTATAAQNNDEYRAVFTNSAGSFNSNPATLTVDSVTTQPTSQSVDAGQSVSFTAASAVSTDTVQWEVSTNGGTTFTPITGATSTTYTFTAADTDSGDEYEAVFTNSAGSFDSNPATLTVDSVTTQPASQSVNAGQSVSFTASSPSSTDTVQWQVSTNGGTTFTPITGATSTTYTFTATAADNGNQYEAVFTNSAGSFDSNPATLTVDSITTQPATQSVNAGQSVSLTAATSLSTDTVQWEVSTDGGTTFTNIAGATSTTYAFTATAADNGDEYKAVFTNSAGTLTSSAATLTVDSVTTQPASQEIMAGQNVTFTAASLNPSGTDTVQWDVSTDGGTTFTAIAGAITTTYSFTATSAQNGDEYEAVFTNSAGSFTSNPATLTVDFAPVVTTNPSSSVLVDLGGNATFTAAASGSPTPTVQWEVSTDGGTTFTDISGATSTTYSFTPTVADSGDEYRAVFTNSLGSATTSAATLTVDSVTTQPGSETINTGQSASFSAASSNPGDTVQWEVSTDGGTTFTDISGATSTTYSFTATGAQNGDEYRAIFTNSGGTLTSTAATLTVDFVTTQPQDQIVVNGQTVTFTAASLNPSGTDTVQWEVSTDGGNTFTDISGATSTTYSFTASAAVNGTEYEAVFNNSLGSFTSNPATFTLAVPPTVTTQPSAATVDIGGTATFTAQASGVPTPTVQWQVSNDGGVTFTDISGATSTTYSFTPTAADSGDEYQAVFTNIAGTATTSAVTLTVDSVTTQPTSQQVNSGQTASFTAASLNPSGTDTVQWEVSTDGGTTFTDISGATSTTYSFTATADNNGDEYEAVFTNSEGAFSSSPATLTVFFAPIVTQNPTPSTANAGGTATFTAAASGNPAAIVQWEVSTDRGATFTAISGATSTTYSFTVTASDSGDEYQAVFTNSLGTATTTAATLTVDSVTTQPASQTVNTGQSVSLTAASSNPGADTVQWQVSTDGGATFTAISGATFPTYTFTATAAQNGDEYEAVFTNSTGTFTSNAATLTVDYVTSQPASQTLNAGQNVAFSAASLNPSGTDTVQWQVSTDGGNTFSDISGATSTTYSFTATAGDNGDEYRAAFTNSDGTFFSNAAGLSTAAAPVVTTQPTSATVGTGNTVTFTAAASGTPTPTVQWEVSTNGGSTFTDISGATSTTYSFTATLSQSGDEYEAVFTNSLGTATTNAVTLTVDTPPVVTTQPAAQQLADAGGGASFTAAASGSPSPTVAWYVNQGTGVFTKIPTGGSTYGNSPTTDTLTISGATPNMNGFQYEAIFTNGGGTATTTPATLTVDEISTQPVSQTVAVGTNVSFTAASSNPSGTDTVQWQISIDGGSTYSNIPNGGVYSGATTGTLTITGATSDLNLWLYRAVFSNSAGTVTSNPAELWVNTGASSTWPAGYSVTPNATTYSSSTANQAGFTINSLSSEIGDTYTYAITSSGGSAPTAGGGFTVIMGSGTITSTSQSVGNNAIDLTGLYDGTITFTVTLTDSSGDTGLPATATALKDTVPPGAFLVVPGQSSYNATTGQQFAFTIEHAQVTTPAETYTWSIMSGGLPTGISGSGQVTSSTFTIPPVDITALPSGKYVIHVVLTNAAGNGNNANATFTFSRPVATFSITPDVPFIGASRATNAGFTFVGANRHHPHVHGHRRQRNDHFRRPDNDHHQQSKHRANQRFLFGQRHDHLQGHVDRFAGQHAHGRDHGRA